MNISSFHPRKDVCKTLYIDGDGCNQKTREIAERLVHRDVRVVVVANRDIPCTQKETRLIICGDEADAADTYIALQCADGDLVITRDLQLCLKLFTQANKKVYVISDNGEIYTPDIISSRIMRSEYAKERRNLSPSYEYPHATYATRKKGKTDRNPVADYLEKWRLGLLR